MKYTIETKVTDMSSKLVIFGFYKKKWLIMSNNGVFKKTKNHDIFCFDVN